MNKSIFYCRNRNVLYKSFYIYFSVRINRIIHSVVYNLQVGKCDKLPLDTEIANITNKRTRTHRSEEIWVVGWRWYSRWRTWVGSEMIFWACVMSCRSWISLCLLGDLGFQLYSEVTKPGSDAKPQDAVNQEEHHFLVDSKDLQSTQKV